MEKTINEFHVDVYQEKKPAMFGLQESTYFVRGLNHHVVEESSNLEEVARQSAQAIYSLPRVTEDTQLVCNYSGENGTKLSQPHKSEFEKFINKEFKAAFRRQKYASGFV